VRSLLTKAIATTGLSGRARAFSGLTPAAKALAVAALAHEARESVVLYVVPADPDLETAINDVRFFLGALEALPDAIVERVVLPFPAYQVDPYRSLAPHFRVTSARARALHAAALGSARVVVASAQALMPRLSPPESVLATSFDLKPGVEIAPHTLAEILVDGGYERQDPVDEHGEFSLRGGILDVYPAGEPSPIRVEFIGDSVESIRRFDPGTQRSIETLDQFQIVPVKEPDTDGAEAPSLQHSVFDYLRASKSMRIVVAEPPDVRAQVDKWAEQIAASFEERSGDKAAGDRERRRPQELMLSWSELELRLADAVSLEELGLDSPVVSDQSSVVSDQSSVVSQSSIVSGQPALREQPITRAEGSSAVRSLHVSTQPAQEFRGRIADWIADVKQARDRNETVLFVASTQGRAERTVELLHDYEIRALPAAKADERVEGAVLVAEGLLSKGFRLPAAALQVYAETDIFEEERRRTTSSRKRSLAATFLSDLRDLKVGDYIVHVDNGIGQFVGLKQLSVGHGDIVQEFLELRYHGDDKMFVPVERLDLVQKYTGGTAPSLDRLGGTSWEKAKKKVKKAMRDMAEELLKLYAARRAVPGYQFSADTHWQEEFEGAFEWDLTVDQVTAVADIKRDMESSMPMDRLLCGDVGYGKTEVAMRAAFKAVMDGKQVAVLAPTTVLAFQHAETMKHRFAAFPARIDVVNRFRAAGETKQILEQAASGRLDVLIGTHRLLSKDVQFRDLGLLIVDEEQRFGVAHKERIKQMRKKVDVLTMTATPIPRTLNMSLVGIRDMSVIETPPKDRLAIQTNVVKFDAGIIQRAIRTELARGGQVFFVHNRIESIFSMGNLIQRLVPEARVVIGHGQMGEHILERAMLDFMQHRADVLLSTTIVENGIDIPNANTIIINRADRYGLSQLYQLRGRVGRSDRPAYAYLLIPPEDSLSAVARKRLAAIREFSDLGSGFRVAALDLEIRGAGNLLGGEQSGQIDAVGYETYMKLLEETIRELKGEDLEDDIRATVNLRIDFRIEEGYIPDMNQRLMVYRRIAAARSEEELTRVMEEVRDRYGPPPVPVLNLADYGRIRVMADDLGVETIDREGSLVVIRFRENAKVEPVRLINMVRDRADLQLFPPVTLKMDLRKPAASAPPPPAAATDALKRAHQLALSDRQRVEGSSVASRQSSAQWSGGSRQANSPPPPGIRRTPRERREPAWWTARATSGEVTAGFSKAEILKPKEEDPRAPGGILQRVEELLEDLKGD
jgi:transcription-repair coupling factor (superfamily II helicase)